MVEARVGEGPPVRLIREDHIATILLNRPERRNPISEEATVNALLDAIAEVAGSKDIHVAILTGSGPAFSSGGDLRRMSEDLDRRKRAPLETVEYYTKGIQRIPLAIAQLDVPMIAAVNGPAIGAGCDLACMCDIRIAAETATFAESFVRLGIVAGDGGAWFLPRVVGFSKACELAFTGDTISARDALACGLVSSIVPDAELMAAAHALAGRIAANPTHAVRMTKRLMTLGRELTLESLLELSAHMQALSHTSDSHAEAVAGLLARLRK